MSEELYKKYRPKSISEIVGQADAVKALKSMVKADSIPHAILLHGASGCGKTTLARILAGRLGSSGMDYREINASESRGIDMVREVSVTLNLAALSGGSKVYCIDECHALTADAQNAFLKILEDTPKHVYFILCTTDPQKVKSTIRTRCTEIQCKPLSKTELAGLVKSVVEKESANLEDVVVNAIADAADGSARKALVILHSVINIPTKGEQLSAIEKSDPKAVGFNIAQALMRSSTKWPDMAELLKSVEDDPETIRYIVLGYARSCLLGKADHGRAVRILEEFRDNFYDSKAAGLALACYNVIH